MKVVSYYTVDGEGLIRVNNKEGIPYEYEYEENMDLTYLSDHREFYGKQFVQHRQYPDDDDMLEILLWRYRFFYLWRLMPTKM